MCCLGCATPPLSKGRETARLRGKLRNVASYVALEDFKAGPVQLKAGTVLSDGNFDVQALRLAGLAVIPYDPALDVWIKAYRSHRASRGAAAEGDLPSLLLADGLLGGGGGVAKVQGGLVANNVASPNTVLDIAPGSWLDSSGARVLSASTEQIDFSTNGAGGLDTGSQVANQWYAAYLIKRLSDGAIAGLGSLDPSSPALPAGWDLSQRFGWARTDGSGNFFLHEYVGDGAMRAHHFNRTGADILAQAFTNGSTSYTTLSLAAFVPPGQRFCQLQWEIFGTVCRIKPEGEPDTTADGRWILRATNTQGSGTHDIFTSANREIEYVVANPAAGGVSIYVLGFVDVL